MLRAILFKNPRLGTKNHKFCEVSEFLVKDQGDMENFRN